MPARTHGMDGTPIYRLWAGIKQRVLNPKNRHYHDYGGRGIKMHPAWVESFETFLKDVPPKPSPLHTLDRKDNNGHYEPGNVRWATRQEQQNNRRANRWLEFRGRRQTVAQWARELGLSKGAILFRLDRMKLPVEEALSAPKGYRNRWLEFRGRRQTLAQWARELGLPKGTILQRLDRAKLPVELALSLPKAFGKPLRSLIAEQSARL